VFKKEYGLSPHAYILNLKVNMAKDLLEDRNNNKNLSEIALESGFYDQSHLNRNFKKSFAITPKNYR